MKQAPFLYVGVVLRERGQLPKPWHLLVLGPRTPHALQSSGALKIQAEGWPWVAELGGGGGGAGRELLPKVFAKAPRQLDLILSP